VEDDTRRGHAPQQAAIFSDILPEERVPPEHPLRVIRAMVDTVRKELSPQFARLFSHTGRPSIAPEKLLRALLRQVLYTVRRERLLMEQLDYNLLFRWFVGLNRDDPIWDASTFSKNRERLLEGDVAHAFFDQVLVQAREIDFRGERRTNATHASTTDPEARLYKKATGQEAKLAYLGHVLMENRHGLVVDTRVTQATGTAEREAALAMAEAIPGQQRVALGADKNYDTHDGVRELRERQVTPHVAQHSTGRSSAIDGRTTRHPGDAVSQRKRNGVEEICGWLKTVGLLRKVRHRGMARVGWMFTCAAAVYNLVRMRTLAAAA
jgi:transposase